MARGVEGLYYLCRKKKALISCAVLICIFVFACAKRWVFFHKAAKLYPLSFKLTAKTDMQGQSDIPVSLSNKLVSKCSVGLQQCMEALIAKC